MGEKYSIHKVLEKLDSFYDTHDLAGAVKYLEGQAAGFQEDGNWKNELTVRNEQVGLYRKIQDTVNGEKAIERSIELIKLYGLENCDAGGTTYMNCATAYRAYGMYEKSEICFSQAIRIFTKLLDPGDYRMASVYHNYALLLGDRKKYKEAEDNLQRALGILSDIPGLAGERATSYVGLAHIYRGMGAVDPSAKQKEEKALGAAWDILEDWTQEKDSYYAFVCDSCAKSFLVLGKEEKGEKLRETARDFYERKGKQAGKKIWDLKKRLNRGMGL